MIQNIKCVTFSDNIAIGLDLSELENHEEAIRSFVKYISIIQSVALKNNFLFRGGIAIGQLYMNSQKNLYGEKPW